MKKYRSFFAMVMVTLFLPTILIFTISNLVLAVLMGATGSPVLLNQFSLVFGLAMAGLILFFVAASVRIAKKVSVIDDITKTLADEKNIAPKTSALTYEKDQLDHILSVCTDHVKSFTKNRNRAKQLEQGRFNQNDQSKDDSLGFSLTAIGNSLENILNEIEKVSQGIEGGHYSTRCAVENLSDDYKRILMDINQVIDTLAEKIEFYEAILDAIPFPLHVMDKEMKWLYMNRGLEVALSQIEVIKDREGARGLDCYHANNPACRTKNCGIQRLVNQGISESSFVLAGQHAKMDVSFLKDKTGKSIGFVEVCTDITAIASVNAYTKEEIQRVETNLIRLTEGNLDFDLNIGEPGDHTKEVSSQFKQIGQSLITVKESIGNLIADVSMMTNAAIEGKLETRADTARFSGAWQDLMMGMNNILIEIERPLLEFGQAINQMSFGQLDVTVTGDYRGEFERLKQVVNDTADQLKQIVGDISSKIKSIADGDLNIEKTAVYPGDFEIISTALNMITDSLNAVVKTIHQGAEQVKGSSGQLSASSQALAQGATEQASSIEELTAAISEIADQAKQSAINAGQANELAKKVLVSAVEGNAQMKLMQEAMQAINNSSQDISKIIKVIDDIAFQTNILALNAAVEAARAGQHGKGFAVVAEEVRTLAARSAEAAKETTTLIEGSMVKAENGTFLTNKAETALIDIVEGIKSVSNLSGNIAVVSHEQATGIGQINIGIEQIAEVVQQNSAVAEEGAAASEELTRQAELLKERIEHFHLRANTLN